jgi:hypothetical protein
MNKYTNLTSLLKAHSYLCKSATRKNYYEILLRTSYTNKEVKKQERNKNIWNRVLHFKSITITITITWIQVHVSHHTTVYYREENIDWYCWWLCIGTPPIQLKECLGPGIQSDIMLFFSFFFQNIKII